MIGSRSWPLPGAVGLEALLAPVTPEVRAILERALAGGEPTLAEAVRLCGASGADLQALLMTADRLRAEQVGDTVTYVVNRNVNFTNACVKACQFCAFSRTHRSDEAYFLEIEEIVRRALEAQALGATEVCIQAGLAPQIDGRFYLRLVEQLKAAAPDLHLHAFSPEEVKYAAGLRGIPIRELLTELKAAGLGSLPGTSAEILDDSIRQRIAVGRISTAEWIEVIRTAHEIGLPTTATIMFGHVETDAQRMAHLDLLRRVQRETGGFTEFVPLSFVHQEAPMFHSGRVTGLRAGPSGLEVVRLYAIARLILGRSFKNLQASWVKEGLRQAQFLLGAGVNDLGGTLMNESISTAAGASHGQSVTPRALRALIREAGRVPAQRDTRYRIVRPYEREETAEERHAEPLDTVIPEITFGTYAGLTRDARFRFVRATSGACE